MHVNLSWCACVVFGIGPANRPESPSPSGVAQGFSLISVDSAGEVAGVVCEVEGEENTRGNGVEGTPDNHMTDEGMIFEKTHQDLSYLEPHAQLREVRNETKCACVRLVRYCLYTPVAFMAVAALDAKLP